MNRRIGFFIRHNINDKDSDLAAMVAEAVLRIGDTEKPPNVEGTFEVPLKDRVFLSKVGILVDHSGKTIESSKNVNTK